MKGYHSPSTGEFIEVETIDSLTKKFKGPSGQRVRSGHCGNVQLTLKTEKGFIRIRRHRSDEWKEYHFYSNYDWKQPLSEEEENFREFFRAVDSFFKGADPSPELEEECEGEMGQ